MVLFFNTLIKIGVLFCILIVAISTLIKIYETRTRVPSVFAGSITISTWGGIAGYLCLIVSCVAIWNNIDFSSVDNILFLIIFIFAKLTSTYLVLQFLFWRIEYNTNFLYVRKLWFTKKYDIREITFNEKRNHIYLLNGRKKIATFGIVFVPIKAEVDLYKYLTKIK